MPKLYMTIRDRQTRNSPFPKMPHWRSTTPLIQTGLWSASIKNMALRPPTILRCRTNLIQKLNLQHFRQSFHHEARSHQSQRVQPSPALQDQRQQLQESCMGRLFLQTREARIQSIHLESDSSRRTNLMMKYPALHCPSVLRRNRSPNPNLTSPRVLQLLQAWRPRLRTIAPCLKRMMRTDLKRAAVDSIYTISMRWSVRWERTRSFPLPLVSTWQRV